ncbi:hypothetical protein ACJMK2_043991 [Sinanodonta woodiana]|uniref:TNFR-Cys domain-containing protein n=1 Tax=Sinanodonta woodiana TaxID=1069815 RepID=A0ABD3W279_SINWO
MMRMTMYDCVHLILSVVCLHQKLFFKGTNACTDMVFCSNGLISNNAYLCYRKDIQDKCCQYCTNLYINIEGCEYGDRLPVCSPLYCNHLFNETDCCRTCNPLYSGNQSSTSPKSSSIATEANLELSDHTVINKSLPSQAYLGWIIGGVVGLIVFLLIVIPIGHIVWRKVSRRQEEEELLLQNRPTVPLRIKPLRTERNSTRNRSSVHTYDLPDNGYIEIYPTFQISCNVPSTVNRQNVSMDTRSYASIGSSMCLNISNVDGFSTENVIQPLTQNSHEKTPGYLTVAAEYNCHRY